MAASEQPRVILIDDDDDDDVAYCGGTAATTSSSSYNDNSRNRDSPDEPEVFIVSDDDDSGPEVTASTGPRNNHALAMMPLRSAGHVPPNGRVATRALSQRMAATPFVTTAAQAQQQQRFVQGKQVTTHSSAALNPVTSAQLVRSQTTQVCVGPQNPFAGTQMYQHMHQHAAPQAYSRNYYDTRAPVRAATMPVVPAQTPAQAPPPGPMFYDLTSPKPEPLINPAVKPLAAAAAAADPHAFMSRVVMASRVLPQFDVRQSLEDYTLAMDTDSEKESREHNLHDEEIKNMTLTDQLNRFATQDAEKLPMADQPGCIKKMLYPYQRQALWWMMEKERRGCGGMLCDDMGLGKTLQTTALIAASQKAHDKFCREQGRPYEVLPTLVVVPLNAFSTWEAEFDQTVRVPVQSDAATQQRFQSEHNTDWTLPFTFLRYHGQNRCSHNPEVLAKTNVVLTTYNLVAAEHRNAAAQGAPGGLFGTMWHRIVLDEAHTIKNPAGKVTRALKDLRTRCSRAWALTGTPIQNTLMDIYSLYLFVTQPSDAQKSELKRVFQTADGTLKKQHNNVRYERGAGHSSLALRRVHELLQGVLLRRTKSMVVNGRPLIELPPLHNEDSTVELDAFGRTFYQKLYARSQEIFKHISKNCKNNSQVYLDVVALITRLRQFVAHPFLVIRGALFPDDKKARVWRMRSYARVLRSEADETIERIMSGGNSGEGFNLDDFDSDDDEDALGALMPLAKAPERAVQPCAAPGLGGTCEMCAQLRCMVGPQVFQCPEDASHGWLCEECHGSVSKCLECGAKLVPVKAAATPAPTQTPTLATALMPPPPPSLDDEAPQRKRRRVDRSAAEDDSDGGEGGGEDDEDDAVYPRETCTRHSTVVLPGSKLDFIVATLDRHRAEDRRLKAIVFSNFTSFLDLLEMRLRAHAATVDNGGVPLLLDRADGNTPPGERSEIFAHYAADAANEPCSRVLLLSTRVGGTALNLVAATVVIIADPWWNPAVDLQALQRVYRIGQTREVHTYRLFVTHSIEEAIMNIQERKAFVAAAALHDTGALSVGQGETRERFMDMARRIFD